MDNAIKKLQVVPGVGLKLAKEFSDIGIRDVTDFKGKNPERLYMQICAKKGVRVDRCVLYVCRTSVYFAEHKNHEPEKLKWWHWKDKK